MTLKAKTPIAVIGGANAGLQACNAAEQLGQELAQRGYAVICGGRGGVMDAVCRGCTEAGGISIGVLPTLDASTANKECTLVIPTNLGNADHPLCRSPEISRNWVIVAGALCVFVVGGGKGTENELKIALGEGKRVFGICDPPELQDAMGRSVWNSPGTLFTRHSSVEEALSSCRSYLNGLRPAVGW